MYCSQCGKQNECMAKFCYDCGSKLKALKDEEGFPDNMFGNNEELENYVLSAQGISRPALNIMCLIGIFIFGWLLAIVFNQLGKKGKGWLYVVPLIFFLIISQLGAGALRPIGFLVYVVGWIHANIVLSRYESLARQRIAKLEGRLPTTSIILEKGLIKGKVLRKTEEALRDFDHAIQLPGGNPRLLNQAGLQYSAANRHTEAKQFFVRALEQAKDENLAKEIKKNQDAAEKRQGRKIA